MFVIWCTVQLFPMLAMFVCCLPYFCFCSEFWWSSSQCNGCVVCVCVWGGNDAVGTVQSWLPLARSFSLSILGIANYAYNVVFGAFYIGMTAVQTAIFDNIYDHDHHISCICSSVGLYHLFILFFSLFLRINFFYIFFHLAFCSQFTLSVVIMLVL